MVQNTRVCAYSVICWLYCVIELECSKRQWCVTKSSLYALLFTSPALISTVVMVAAGSSETSIHLFQSMRYHIPDNNTLYTRRCSNLKSHSQT